MEKFHKIGKIISVFLLCFCFIVTSAHSMQIKSDVFKELGYIPVKYTGFGKDISPYLKWKDVPEGTKSFAIIMDDPDAPGGTWVHWVIYNIPAKTTYLQEAVPKKDVLDDGSLQGINSFSKIGYDGPHPPPGPAHRYLFQIYALDIKLDISPGASKETIVNAIEGHVLSQTKLVGRFSR